MTTYEIDKEAERVITKIAKKCAVDNTDVVAEAIGLVESVFNEVKKGNEIYVVSKDGKALARIKLNIEPKK